MIDRVDHSQDRADERQRDVRTQADRQDEFAVHLKRMPARPTALTVAFPRAMMPRRLPMGDKPVLGGAAKPTREARLPETQEAVTDKAPETGRQDVPRPVAARREQTKAPVEAAPEPRVQESPLADQRDRPLEAPRAAPATTWTPRVIQSVISQVAISKGRDGAACTMTLAERFFGGGSLVVRSGSAGVEIRLRLRSGRDGARAAESLREAITGAGVRVKDVVLE